MSINEDRQADKTHYHKGIFCFKNGNDLIKLESVTLPMKRD